MNKVFCYIPLLVLFCGAIQSCEKEEPTPPKDPALSGPLIRWDRIEVGQVSRYVLFHGKEYGNPDGAGPIFQKDTLIVQVAAKEGDAFLIKESLSAGSETRTGVDKWGVLDPDSTYTYLLKVDGDTLRLMLKTQFLFSRLFHYQTGEKLPLSVNSSTKVSIRGWQLDLPYFENYLEAIALEAKILDRTYPKLNVVVNNLPMQYDGPGSTYIYSPETGMVRAIIYSWWTREGWGWDLLSQE